MTGRIDARVYRVEGGRKGKEVKWSFTPLWKLRRQLQVAKAHCTERALT